MFADDSVSKGVVKKLHRSVAVLCNVDESVQKIILWLQYHQVILQSRRYWTSNFVSKV